MRSETSCKYISDLKTVIKDTFSGARIYTMTHSRLCKWVDKKVYSHHKYARLPDWAKGKLGGYIDAQFEFMYHWLEWRVQYPTGTYILGKDVPKGEWANVQTGAFFYKDTDRSYNEEIFEDGYRQIVNNREV